jgi:dienelactone hydrolase
MSSPLNSQRTASRPLKVLLSFALMSFGLGMTAKSGIAQVPAAINANLNEEVLMVPMKGGSTRLSGRMGKSSGADTAGTGSPSARPASQMWAGELETTLYKPPGQGPFPVLILNHGKALGNPHAQERARFLAISREFLKRGYAVVIPMRTGFSKSSGDYAEQHCNMTVNGYMQAKDLQSVLDYVHQQPWADRERIVVAGQSYGGLTALAFASYNIAGVRGVINFAGGLKTTDGGCQWQDSLTQAFAEYGAHTAVPSLWFYGKNDSYFGPELAARLHDAYTHAGGKATLIAFGAFKNDAHAMSGSRDGVKIWWPQTEKFLASIGLPTTEIYTVEEPELPPRTDFAKVDNVDALPYVREKGREQYRVFLTKSLPRAFAISASGAWSWTEDGDDPAERALASCQKNSILPCKLYAVDDYVVWNGTKTGEAEQISSSQ